MQKNRQFFMAWATALVVLLQGEIFAASKNDNATDISWWRQFFGTISWEEVQSRKMTPEKIIKLVHNHVDYRSEDVDVWSGGRETWERRCGDCEDIAACIAELCQTSGYEAWIQVFLHSESFQGHAVAMVRIDGKLWLADKSFILVGTMEEAKTVISREMRWSKGAVHAMPLASIHNAVGTVAADVK